MLERLQKMDFCVEPIKVIWTLHHLIYVDLIPCNLNTFDLIKCLVTR